MKTYIVVIILKMFVSINKKFFLQTKILYEKLKQKKQNILNIYQISYQSNKYSRL